MKLELYSIDLSPYGQKVKLQLEMKQISFESHAPEREFVRAGGYGELNPIRKIPTLVVDGVPLPEAEVISEFIEDMFPNVSLRPSDALELAKMRLLSRIADLYVMSPIVDMLNNLGELNSDDIAANARARIAKGINWLEHWISEGPYALGEIRSVADAAVPPVLFFVCRVFPCLGLGELPALGAKTQRYFDAISADPHIAACLERMERARSARFDAAN